ncbi:beta-glucoside-specific PTS transporter subunit IIABC [Clostridium beijerinckii]|uniref:PTS system beta-glucosides-specific IIC component n=1 Tax=Clostridium beijerinckii TaxID=1520 RepID=A0AAE5LNA6_CLOBE|nr:beta-glucoside-specific PTS transporter subunit IIABC [Clostridium beijerinckii]NSB12337.1 PTS system beta-glucosides-specific IIC component [Clostridium beijerinckii]OOM30779.1 PTS system beta-glucoside-specific EIIBCA component [Clostridium beijerinckii]
MKKEDVVAKIIKEVGGKDNIKNAWHCMTRLRFDLKDKTKVNQEAIQNLEGIVGSQFNKEQFQIVIGTTVDKYYNILITQLDLNINNNSSDKDSNNQLDDKKSLTTRFMDTVSGVFGPIVPAIAGAGMIKGLIAGLVALKFIAGDTDTMKVIDMIASGVFTFLPFFLAVSAAKKFKTNEYLSVAIAATIMYPTMVDTAKAGKIGAFYVFGILPIPVFNYSSSVIPIIFAVWVLSYVHKLIDKHMPDTMRTVFTPTLTLFISGFLTLGVTGPIGIYLGRGLAWIIASLFSISPILAGVIVGAIRPVAILTGMHHAMTPIALQNFATQGYDMLMPMMFMTNISITGAAAAIYFRENTKQGKTIVISSVISGLFGITEPALFGILSKYKKAFLAATIGSTVASAFISFFGVRLYGYVLSSVFSIPAYIGPYFIYAMLGILIALSVSFALSYLFVVKGNKEIPSSVKNNDAETISEIASVMTGEVNAITEAPDSTFAQKLLGDGFVVFPSNGTVVAPFDGKITMIYKTKHAIALTSNSGLEVLIHIGLDTVTLNGEGFELLVKEGDNVKMGQTILNVDLDFMKSKEIQMATPVIITNLNEKVITLKKTGNVKAGEIVLDIK